MKDTTTFDSRDLIAEAIRAHGPRRVILSALRALIASDTRPTNPTPPLSDHIRRDIGLDPEKPPPSWTLIR